MAQLITLAQLRTEVGYAADVVIGEDRYPNAMVNGWINQAIQHYQLLRREMGTSDEQRALLNTTASTSLGTSGFPLNELVALPADFQSLISVYLVTGTVRNRLTALSPVDRHNDLTVSPLTGIPTSYDIVDATTTQPAQLRLWPAASAAYQLEVIYTPEPTTLTADGDSWEYSPGTLDLVVCAAALKVLDRDGIPEPSQYQALQNRQAAAEQALKRFTVRDPGVLTMRNTREHNAARRRLGVLP
jgi:hypothetical protein